MNAQKSLAFLYTNNEKSEREFKETVPFTIAAKRIKYLGINLLKETKDLYEGNNYFSITSNHCQAEDHIQCDQNFFFQEKLYVQFISENSPVLKYW